MQVRLWARLPLLLALMAGLALAACNRALPLSDYSYEGLYAHDLPVVVRAKPLLDSAGQLRVHTELVARKIPLGMPKQALLDKYLITCRLSPDYTSRTIISLDTVNLHQLDRDADGIFHFWFPVRGNQGNPAVLAITVKERQTEREFMVDVPLELNYANLHYRYAVYPVGKRYPFAGNFFRVRDTVEIRGMEQRQRPLYVKYYGNNLPAALPAMSSKPPLPVGKPTLRYDLSSGKRLKFESPGLYFAQEDTNSREGFAFLVQPNKYPFMSREADLMAPLIYVTTAYERRKIAEAKEPKKALDQFWMGVGGNTDHARRVLRSYYEAVELANEQFTSMKEGWKTDRGMVFIIFGPPDQVLKNNLQEEWTYGQVGAYENISFLFEKKPTIFTPENYELVRSPDYERIWYSRVDQWRKGTLRR